MNKQKIGTFYRVYPEVVKKKLKIETYQHVYQEVVNKKLQSLTGPRGCEQNRKLKNLNMLP